MTGESIEALHDSKKIRLKKRAQKRVRKTFKNKTFLRLLVELM